VSRSPRKVEKSRRRSKQKAKEQRIHRNKQRQLRKSQI
jgi:hypothetical protein